MGGLVLRDLSSAVIRANPRYDFSPFGHLTGNGLAGVGKDVTTTTFAGILTDRGAGTLNVKAISPRTAALVAELRTPLTASQVLADCAPGERDRILAALILDGILEIAPGDGFVSQCGAYRALVEDDHDLLGTSRLAMASIAALRHGQRLAIREPEVLAARLYFYQRLPVTASWAALWPNASAVLAFLGISPGRSPHRDPNPAAAWSPPAPATRPGQGQWLYGHRPGARTRPRDGESCKLYVSPAPRHVRPAFAEVMALLPGSAASSYKIGPNAHGLLRPDKLMVYFDSHPELIAFAERLAPRLADLTAHGVPFTAPIDDAGMLSWGVDPPRDEAAVGGYVDESWRIWICNRLALALIAAADDAATRDAPWRYALARLWLSGVDTRTWTRRRASTLEAVAPPGGRA